MNQRKSVNREMINNKAPCQESADRERDLVEREEYVQVGRSACFWGVVLSQDAFVNREMWTDRVWADRDRVCKRCHSILENGAWNRRQEHKERKAGLQSMRYVLCGQNFGER